MKPSFYNFYQSTDNNILIFNTISGNCVVIPKKEYKDKANDKLVKMGFYVPSEKDELEDLVVKGQQHLLKKDYNKYRVLTTTACNAHCSYCYEHGVHTVTMNMETADKIADFILSQNKDSNLIGIEWFGGEPLLNKKVINRITNRIMKYKASKTRYEAYMVSNGNLLDKKTIDEMEEIWHVKRIQITLDGVGKKYEKVKGLPAGSFDKVIDNLRMLSQKHIKINIRLNFDRNSLNNMEEIIRYLSELDFKNRLYVYPAPIFSATPKTQTKQEAEEMKDAELKMYDLLYRYGLLKSLRLLPHIMPSPCAASKPGYFTINANGDIFKCDRQFLPSNKIGSVFESPFIKLDVSGWSLINVRQKCRECKMFPLCWGGCIYEVMAGVNRCHFSEEIIQHNLAILLTEYELTK